MMKRLKRILYRIYLHIPFSQVAFRLIRSITLPSYKYRRWMRFAGIFVIPVAHERSIRMVSYGNTIENELFWRGLKGWEPFSLRIWQQLSANSGVILDVGANTGLYSILASHVSPSARIWAFEPIPVILQRLERNLQLNNSHVSVVPFALSSSAGQHSIFVAKTISGTFDQATMSKERHQHRDVMEIQIQTRRLDDFLTDLHLPAIELMKIDVETFEPEVLSGMGLRLKSDRPTLLIEILNNSVARRISALISDVGYQVFKIQETGTLPVVASLSEEKGGGNYLLIANERHLAVMSNFR